MSAKLGAAVIGLGVGRGHAKTYRDEPRTHQSLGARTELRLICDIDKKRLEEVSAEFGPAASTKRRTLWPCARRAARP